MQDFSRIFVLGLLCCFSYTLVAQSSDSIYLLTEIEVTRSRLAFDENTFSFAVDSNLLSLSGSKNLSQVLALTGPGFIKQYGPANLATSSFRGGAAQHTAVLWNGFKLDSPTLGQIDLSLLPVSLVERVKVSPGNGGAIWGSGAIGATIHLLKEPSLSEQVKLEWQGMGGSFGQLSNHLEIDLSGKKWGSQTSLFHKRATNAFPYLNANGIEVRLPNATVQTQGFIQTLSHQLPQRQFLEAAIWLQAADREIPPTRLQNNSVATQSDKSLRATLNWQYRGPKLLWKARTAFFSEQLLYVDSLANIYSDSRFQIHTTELEVNVPIQNRHILHLGLHQQSTWTRFSVYENNPSRFTWALLGAWKWESGQWNGQLSGRQERTDKRWLPFIPSFMISRKWGQQGLIKGRIGRSYRLPTFNDWYYQPGGNPDLRPETGWSQELDMTTSKTIRNHSLRGTLSFFNRNMKDWIIWLPGTGGFFTPQNIQSVWSRGASIQANWEHAFPAWSWSWTNYYEWVRSTNQEAKSPGDASVGKQLIYVPKHQLKSNLQFHLPQEWHVRLDGVYTGEVYLLADNSSSLPPYFLMHMTLAKSLAIKNIQLQLFFRTQNIGNTSYEVVVSRPMPGRSFEFGLHTNFQAKNKK